MATTASATLCPATFASATVAPARSSGRATSTKVTYIKGLNSFGGLKAHNTVASLGTHACTEQQFANMVCAMKKKLPSSNKGGGGGALTSTCSAVAEIFRIAAIMNGLTLVGVAVGFVLLRIEASVEESAE
uniref:Putative PetM of cytochrome b6/f complex subunit 7 n=1 Tax=Tanacetum cinerariifolium TaxID=118510 RepID=A0A6L2JJH4_TANCI|nr:putative PetM of cytochrome b6/f complex subunit 7 [Tanacetum cinerariifolium]